MKRTLMLIFTLALLVAWGSTATAAVPASVNLTYHSIANGTSCLEADYDEPVMSFPYFPGTAGGWWNGMAIINKSNTVIGRTDTLCMDVTRFAANDATNATAGNWWAMNSTGIRPAAAIQGRGTYAFLGEVEDRFVVNVFANSTNVLENERNRLAGFGMMGAGPAQGYFALLENTTRWGDVTGDLGTFPANLSDNGTRLLPNRQGNNVYFDGNATATLSFDYFPNSDASYWRGLAIYSPNMSGGVAVTDSRIPDPQLTLTFNVYYENGVIQQFDRTLAPRQMLVGFLENLDLDGEVNTELRARIDVTTNATNAQSHLQLIGFGMMADVVTDDGQGFLANPLELYNATGRISLQPVQQP